MDAPENSDADVGTKRTLAPLPIPSDDTLTQLRQIALAAFPDHVARREVPAAGNRVAAYRCSAVDALVYIHPSSSLYGTNHEFLIFHNLFESRDRHYMRGAMMLLLLLPVVLVVLLFVAFVGLL